MKTQSIARTSLVYGLIAGFVISSTMLLSLVLPKGEHPDLNKMMIIGYLTMIIGFSLIFFAIRSYRNSAMGGYITFSKALSIGLLISSVATVIYISSWMLYYNSYGKEFTQKYVERYAKELKQSDKPQAVIDEKIKSTTEQMERYDKEPVFRILMTIMEILPVGLVVSLICALILKKKPKLQMETA